MPRGLGIGEGKSRMKDLTILISSEHIPIRCPSKLFSEKIWKHWDGQDNQSDSEQIGCKWINSKQINSKVTQFFILFFGQGLSFSNFICFLVELLPFLLC